MSIWHGTSRACCPSVCHTGILGLERENGSFTLTDIAPDAEYRISSNSVLIASRIPANSRKTPAGLRLGYYRVNRVVFGTRAHEISDKIAPIVASVASDPSGRTRAAKRVAGRTVYIARDTAKGLLIYRVGTD